MTTLAPNMPVTWQTGPKAYPITLAGRIIATRGEIATVRSNGGLYEVAMSKLMQVAPVPVVKHLATRRNTCQNCGLPGRIKVGRCERCYQFRRRHGVDRPATVEPLRIQPGTFAICQNCGETPIEARGRCRNCYQHLRKYGVERDRRRRTRYCIICGRVRRMGRSRCHACDSYFRRVRTERPERLWMRGWV